MLSPRRLQQQGQNINIVVTDNNGEEQAEDRQGGAKGNKKIRGKRRAADPLSPRGGGAGAGIDEPSVESDAQRHLRAPSDSP
jgi:hypothetical protein